MQEGFPAQEPVILTKKALEAGESMYQILVDNPTAKENVTRFATHQGYKVSYKEEGEDYIHYTEKMKEAFIATFYSHFGAMAFHKQCKEAGFESRIMPVPRTLSSSCGTCVWFKGDPGQLAAGRWRNWRDGEMCKQGWL